MNCRNCATAILLGAAIFATGCRKSSESNAPPAPQPADNASQSASDQSAPAPKQRLHHFFDNGVAPYIVSMSPETIFVRDGHAPMQRFSLTYEIGNPEKATRAEIQVKVPGVGEVQHFDVDIVAHAQIEFQLDASNFDLGPDVRFRAHCPFGDTDWFTMGVDPVSPPPRFPDPKAGTIGPQFVSVRGGQSAGGVQVQIWNPQITRDCTPEGQVDGRSIELQNVTAGDKFIRGLLLYSDLQGRSVAEHHFEVELVVYSPGTMARADLYVLPFSE